MSRPLRWLYPCLQSQSRLKSRAICATYLRFYQAIRSYSASHHVHKQQDITKSHQLGETTLTEPRIRTGGGPSEPKYLPEPYPRITNQEGIITYKAFREKYKSLARGDFLSEEVIVRGRILSTRIAGSKLAFIDLFQDVRALATDNHRLQCVINYDKISGSGVTPSTFKDFLGSLHRGDVFSVKGVPNKTQRGELSVLATEIPGLLSRCAQPLPDLIKDPETLIQNRHVDLLLNPELSDVFQVRADIIKFLRDYLSDDGHIEVQTPIIAGAAGGAIARPFKTSASEFPDRQITLRIAPELWLKRLILGGFEKVFEIGSSFRNEGISMNHNPEFTTCEFYKTYANLEELINMTEKMFLGLSRVVSASITSTCTSLQPTDTDFNPPYSRLDFVPAIEAAIGQKLPLLTSPDAKIILLDILEKQGIHIPSPNNIPRLLDKLSSTYLEPQCTAPTWIINHPECLSPLSKSFHHPDNQQRVAARAELFVNTQELVNCYEEENSPGEQRRKFEEQLGYHEGDVAEGIDESYLQALEWGLPPTGGWGCGIDRLCMLFSGRNRISDVLSFGTLRNVVSLGQSGKR